MHAHRRWNDARLCCGRSSGVIGDFCPWPKSATLTRIEFFCAGHGPERHGPLSETAEYREDILFRTTHHDPIRTVKLTTTNYPITHGGRHISVFLPNELRNDLARSAARRIQDPINRNQRLLRVTSRLQVSIEVSKVTRFFGAFFRLAVVPVGKGAATRCSLCKQVREP